MEAPLDSDRALRSGELSLELTWLPLPWIAVLLRLNADFKIPIIYQPKPLKLISSKYEMQTLINHAVNYF